jgi:hypothetical protein
LATGKKVSEEAKWDWEGENGEIREEKEEGEEGKEKSIKKKKVLVVKDEGS